MKEQETETVYFQFVPEHYLHNISVTIHCKRSEYNRFKNWFTSFKKQTELNIESINQIIAINEQRERDGQ